MAYVGHSSIREYRTLVGSAAFGANLSLVAKSAVVAAAVAVAVIALADGGGAASEGGSMAKGDRVTAPLSASAVAGAGFTVDAAAQTTVVERGAATPLSPDSPFSANR